MGRRGLPMPHGPARPEQGTLGVVPCLSYPPQRASAIDNRKGISWITTGLTVAAGVLAQVTASWDKSSGWFGLAVAVMIAVSAEVARSKVYSPASVTQIATHATIMGTGPGTTAG
jgi:hypothetical protein